LHALNGASVNLFSSCTSIHNNIIENWSQVLGKIRKQIITWPYRFFKREKSRFLTSRTPRDDD